MEKINSDVDKKLITEYYKKLREIKPIPGESSMDTRVKRLGNSASRYQQIQLLASEAVRKDIAQRRKKLISLIHKSYEEKSIEKIAA